MTKAPNFSLPDQDGKVRSLGDYAGRWFVLYSYPEDDTPGCTIEACGFRDFAEAFTERDLSVVGISPDDVASHAKFARKYGLHFPLLADTDHRVLEAYGAWGPKKFLGKEYVGVSRKTWLINPEGEIVKEYPKVNPAGHAEAILRDFKALAG